MCMQKQVEQAEAISQKDADQWPRVNQLCKGAIDHGYNNTKGDKSGSSAPSQVPGNPTSTHTGTK